MPRTIFAVLVLLSGMIRVSAQEMSSTTSTSTTSGLRAFTVADSIEMSHFIDPPEKGSGHAQASPDGSRIFVLMERGILASNVREFSLLVYDLHNLSSPRRVTTFSSSSNRPGIDHVKWINNDSISFVAENPGELPQVYLLDWKSGKNKKLTSAQQGVREYDISANGKTLAYYTLWNDDEAVRNKDTHGFAVGDESLADLVDGAWRQPNGTYIMYVKALNSGKTQRVHASPVQGVGDLKAWLSPDGRYAIAREGALSLRPEWGAYEEHDVANSLRGRIGHSYQVRFWFPRQLMLVDTKTAEMTPLLDAPSPGNPTVAWSSDGHSVVVCGVLLPLDAKDPDELAKRKSTLVMAEVDVPSGGYRRIVDLPADETWEVREGEAPNTVLVDRLGKRTDNTFLPVHTEQFRHEADGWRNAGDYKEKSPGANIVISQALESRPRLVKIDEATHHETVILDPNPQFERLSFGKVEIIHWTGKKSEPLTAGLIYPTDFQRGTRYPLVVQTYHFLPHRFLLDGPHTTADAAQELANKGIVVLQLPQSPLLEPSEWTPEYGRVEASQVESAIDYLDGLGVVDRERVGLVGFSKTGHQVMYPLVFSSYHFAAATSAEGANYGFMTYLEIGTAYGSSIWDQMYGGLPWNNNWKSWMEHSVSFNYERVHTPLRLESDSNDPRDRGTAGVLNEWEAFAALKKLRKPVELIFVPHGAHPVEKPWDRMTSQGGNVDWMVFWLKGEEDPDPSKAEQYARWRELKKLQEADRKATVAAE